MSGRNRASGWKHAKLSGHSNEQLLDKRLNRDEDYQRDLLRRIGRDGRFLHASVGGPREKNVECIFPGETTKSKTDMYILLDDGSRCNISIKKSLGGQVYLIRDQRFILGFERQYGKPIPESVQRAIQVFWGSAEDTPDLIKAYGTSEVYERRKNRLVADSLKVYDANLYYELLQWFVDNAYEITDFCFSKGLAKNREDWADILWYKNELGENSVDEVIPIGELCNRVQRAAQAHTSYGTRGGGTTIQLPFGFVQWHQAQMQFHHRYDRIHQIMAE